MTEHADAPSGRVLTQDSAAVPEQQSAVPVPLGLNDRISGLALVSRGGRLDLDRYGDQAQARIEAGGLVARERELAHLDDALWAPRQGESSVVILLGEPGMGKSSLIQAAISRADDFRSVLLRGTLFHEGSKLPSTWPQPIVDLLEQFPSSQPSGDEGQSQVLHDSSTLDPSIVSATTEVLRTLIGPGLAPLLLSVDDCHLLPSWFASALVEAVSSYPTPIVLVLAVSAMTGASPYNAGGTRVAGIPAHELRGLNAEQAQLVVQSRCQRTPAPQVLSALVQSTAGNPEAILDACSLLDSETLAGHRPLPDPIPIAEPLMVKFAGRFSLLPEETRAALTVASAGRASYGMLALALEDLNLSIDALDPAEKANIVVILGDRVDFTYPIERAAIYHLAAEDVRSKAHLAISKALLSQGIVEGGAYHAALCADGQSDQLARLHVQAARIALDRGNAEAAAIHHEVASEFAESDEATAHHLVLAASLLVTIGRIDSALVCLDQATLLDPSDHLRARTAYVEARARFSSDLGPEIAEEMIAAADLCRGDSTDWAVLMLVDAATCLLTTGSWNQALSVAERARDLSQAVGAHGEALANATVSVVSCMTGEVGLTTPNLLASTRHLVALTDRFLASPQLAWFTAFSLLQEGHPKEALRWADWIERCAEKVGDRGSSVIPGLVRSVLAFEGGRFDASIADAQSSVDKALECGHEILAAQAVGVLVTSCAARGLHQRGFEASASLFALSDDTGWIPRVLTMVALATLELQRGRDGTALAWMQAAHEEFASGDDDTIIPPLHIARIVWMLTYTELVTLTRRDEDLTLVAQTIEKAQQQNGIVRRAWLWWMRGMCATEIDRASECFETALSETSMPLTRARIELSWGTRLATVGLYEEARDRLGHAVTYFRKFNADGWVRIAIRALERIPQQEGAVDPESEDALQLAVGVDPGRNTEAGIHDPLATGDHAQGHASWEITLLGSFTVRHEGQPISLPISLAAQALKIVSLRRRVSVDELVELLWPDAHPGVGNRRLRNVLWRNRVSCGDLLYRDGNFICLDKEAVVDAEQFRLSAERAIESKGSSEETSRLCREALALYPGELLPEDRYVDWPTTSREQLSRLYIRLLDQLLDQVIGEEQPHEALVLLDRLIEVDPYEERHYLSAAELHAESGNVGRALSTLSRAEETLTELGVGPSSSIERARHSLQEKSKSDA